MPTFQSVAKKAPLYSLKLVKREDFSKKEEQEAAQKEAKASQGMNKTLRITYGLQRGGGSNFTMFFFSLAAVEKYLKTEARPGFNICHDCLVPMKSLKSYEGDPEGMRNDSKCPKCGSVYGCSKAAQFLIRTKYGSSDKSWKPLVEGDPVNFRLASNHLRSFIAVLRNSTDSGPKTLVHIQQFEQTLDKLADEVRKEHAAEVAAGYRAG